MWPAGSERRRCPRDAAQLLIHEGDQPREGRFVPVLPRQDQGSDFFGALGFRHGFAEKPTSPASRRAVSSQSVLFCPSVYLQTRGSLSASAPNRTVRWPRG